MLDVSRGNSECIVGGCGGSGNGYGGGGGGGDDELT